MENLPQEIIIDILSRVPAKTVGRCRCVSKPLKSLLSQPEFLKTHLKQTQHSNLIHESLIIEDTTNCGSLYSAQLSNVFDEITINATKLDFIDPLFKSTIYVAHPCNGLMLVGDIENNFYLINPLTKETKQLPEITYPVRPYGQYVSSYGVGYDSVSDDYKVVVILSFKQIYYEDMFDKYARLSLEKIVNVYSLRNNRWTIAESPPNYYYGTCLSRGVCIGGFIHWVATKVESFIKSAVIVTFDLQKEKYGEIQTPCLEYSNKVCNYQVQRLGSYLCFLYVLEGGVVELWRMEEYGVVESWTKYLVVDPDHVSVVPLCLMPKQQLVMGKDLFKYYGRDQKLVVYDLKDGAFKDIQQVHGTPANGYSANWTFIESLVSFHELPSL